MGQSKNLKRNKKKYIELNENENAPYSSGKWAGGVAQMI
jgi:hypothetical protein